MSQIHVIFHRKCLWHLPRRTLEKVSWNNTSPCTIAYFLQSNVFETPMASLSSVGKSHYEVQQSFSFPSALLYWALASLGYAALLWTMRLFLSSKVEKILACSSEHLSKWKKEDSKQLGFFFESAGKHKHLCMSDILICLSVVLFWREQNSLFSPPSAVHLTGVRSYVSSTFRRCTPNLNWSEYTVNIWMQDLNAITL